MLWDCFNQDGEEPEGCLAVSPLPPVWSVLRVCSKHSGQLETSLREAPSKDVSLPYQIVVVHSPSYEEKRGADWDALQQRLAEGYETLIVGTDRRIAGIQVFILRRTLSGSIAYAESELLGLLGPAEETGVNDVLLSGERLFERYMRWECPQSKGGTQRGYCRALSTGEEWFMVQVCAEHEQKPPSTTGQSEDYQLLLIDEDTYDRKRGDWNTLQARRSQGFEVALTAKYHQLEGFNIFLLRRSSPH